LAPSLALSPLLEYLPLHLSASGPAELLSDLSAPCPAPKGRPAHLKNTSKPSREAFHDPLSRLQIPKDPLTTSRPLPNFSGSPSSNSRPDSESRRIHHQASRTRSNFQRTRPRRSTVTPWNSKEPRTAPSLAFEHSRNPSTDVRETSRFRRIYRYLISPPGTVEPFTERPTHRRLRRAFWRAFSSNPSSVRTPHRILEKSPVSEETFDSTSTRFGELG
jgi:hypothetical protein